MLGEENLHCLRIAAIAAMLQEVLVNLSDRSGSADEDKIIIGMESTCEMISREMDEVASNIDIIQTAISHGSWAQEKAA